MRLAQKEFIKIMKSPFSFLVFGVFLILNFLMIYSYVGEEDTRKELKDVHKVVLDDGASFRGGRADRIL